MVVLVSLLLPVAARAQTITAGGAINFTTSDSTALSSTVSVTGAPGPVATVQVSLLGVTSNGIAYNSIGYAEFLLQSPSGAQFVLLGATGDGIDYGGLSGVNITIEDSATATAPAFIPWSNTSTQTVKPSSYFMDNFGTPPPLPTSTDAADYPQTDGSATLNGKFNGVTANGTWTLYLIDNDNPVDPVSITGWTLSLTYGTGTSTNTVLSSSSNPAYYANSASTASITYTATVTPSAATGTVTFQANGATISGCNAVALSGGVAHCITTLAQGNYGIAAQYSPTGSYGQSSGSLEQLVEVTPANPSGDQWCNNRPVSDPASDNVGLVYPSIIGISDSSYNGKTVGNVTVELEGLQGTAGIAGQYLLVAPGGGTKNLVFLQEGWFNDSGSTSAVNLTFDDTASVTVPYESGTPTTGTYLPTDNNEGANLDTFQTSISPSVDSTVPQVPGTLNFAPPYGSDTTQYAHTNVLTFGEAFNGASANGKWALYSVSPGATTLNDGWCITLALNTGVATTTTLTPTSGNPATTGNPVTITASVNDINGAVTGGTVTFLDNGVAPAGTVSGNNVVSVIGGAAAFTTSSLTEGDHAITASYSGVTNVDNPSYSSALYQRINTATTSANVNSNTWQYCNPGAVQIQSGSLAGPLTPNPSVISVANLPGTLNTVSVTLKGFSVLTTYGLQELASLVESPSGAALDFFSNTTQGASGNGEASLGNYIFEDSASSLVSAGNTSITPGNYKPTAYINNLSTPDVFTSSLSGFYNVPSFSYALAHGSSTFADIFTDGSNANGTWSLFFSSGNANATFGAANGWCVNLTENLPTVTVSASHSGNFTQGQLDASLTVGIENSGANGPTGDPSGTNPMTVTDTLNSSFTYAGYSGTNWSCSAAVQIVTCTNDSAIAQGSSYPTLTINVNVADAATGPINNSVTASGAGVSSTNSNTDSITVNPAPVLSVSKTHVGNFTQGSTAPWIIQVTNNSASSSGATSGATVTVQDTLPSGYTMASYSGSGWSCTGSTTVTCTSTQTVAGAGGNFPLISLTVNVPASSPTSVSNTALVWGGGDFIHTSLGTAASGSDNNVTVVQVPASITVNGGGTQSAAISTAFGTPLAVTVKDAGGNPINNSSVTFTAPSSGASGTFSNSSNTITVNTNPGGVAIAGTFTANGTTGGPYLVSVTDSPATAASFSLTNVSPPTVTAGATVTFVVGGSPVALDSGLTVSSSSSTLTGATVSIASGAGAADVLSFTTQNGITGSFSAGTLTLTGTATVAAYQVALESVTFSTTSTSVTPRTINWTVTNSFASSAPATSTVNVLLPPTVSGISPTTGTTAGGTPVTITGANFTGATGVTIGGTAATNVVVVSGTSITATTPAGTAGTASVVVTIPGGSNAANSLFTFVAPPTVSGISPSTGPTAGGTPVTITGANFTGATSVTIGGTAATSVVVVNGTTIVATTPAGTAGTASVVVTTPYGSNAVNSLFTFVAPPTVSGISPSTGLTTGGTIVTITGTNLVGATGVHFGSTAATITSDSSTQIVATAPAGSNTVDVTVITPGGTSVASTADQFTYLIPIATSLTPSVTPSSTFVYDEQPTNISVALTPLTATGIVAADFTAMLDGTTGLTVTAGAGNTFSIALPATPLTVGAHSIAVNFAATLTETLFYQASSTSISLTVTTPNLVVTTNQDDAGTATNCTVQTTPGTGTDAACSLRDALLLAANAGSGSITFDGTAFAATNSASVNTITLSHGTLNIPAYTSITGATSGSGATLTNLVTVAGGGPSSNFSVFTVSSGVTGSAINNLTITNGYARDGGGINNSGTLTITNSTISGNSVKNDYGGGGIFNYGTLTLAGSAVSGNSAACNFSAECYGGGGIFNYGTGMTVSNSTISGNFTTGSYGGGGIYNYGSALTVTNSTISGNFTNGSYGGGIYNEYGTLLALANSIVDGNWLGSLSNISKYDDLDDGSGNSLFTSSSSNNLGDVVGLYNNPQATAPTPAVSLAVLGNYGGPTQTRIPLPGSNGICSGTSTPSGGLTLPATDQRGFGFVSTYCPSGHVDAGAVQTNYAMRFTTQPPASINTNVLFTAPHIPAVTLTESGSTATYASGTVNASGSLPAVTLSGTTSATLSAGVGSFSGLTLSSASDQTGETLTATLNLNGSLNLTATSNPFNVIALTFLPASLSNGTVGVAYSQQITASGGTGPYTYSVSTGTLPAGLLLTPSGANAGLLSGTPTAGGTFNFSITAIDNLGNSGGQAYTLVVSAPTIIVTPATLTSGTYGTSYNQSVSASGGTASYTFTLAGGSSLPPGLSLSSSGTITGTPSQASATAYTFTIIATDSSSGTGPYTGSKLVSLTIAKANPTLAWATPAAITYGVALSGAQLDAAATGVTGATLPGTFTYLPLSGVVLTVGPQTLSVSFVPNDTTDYTTPATTTVQLQVGKANPTLAWATPAAITYGTALSGTQLDAVATGVTGATLPGTFTYSPLSGVVLTAGPQTLSVSFVPNDTTNYTTPAKTTVQLQVNKAASAVTLASSLNPILIQNPVTYTATVSSSAGLPTGTVAFSDGGTVITACASVAVTTATGLANCAVTYTATGTHNITAVYSGDTNFLAAGPSNTVSEAAIDINLGTSTSSQTILPGDAATYSFLIAPSSGATFPSPVTFTVNTLPALPSGTTLTLAPSAWVFNSNNPWSWTLPASTSLTGNTVLTIQLPQTTSSAQPAGGNLASRLAPFSLALLLLPFAGRLRKSGKRLGRLLAIVLLAGAGAATLAGLSGCGSNTGFFAQTQQNYTVTVTVGNGSLSHTSTVTLTVE